MSGKLFISYSHKDDEFVGKLIHSLQGEGYGVWIDSGELDIGHKWRGEIVAGIKAAAAFLLVVSPHSGESDEVRKELSLAEDFKRKIFPIVIGDAVISDALAYQLAGLQYIVFAADQYDAALQRLVRGLKAQAIEPEFAGLPREAQAAFHARKSQLAALDERYRAALAEGRAAVCFVSGDAGSGKTALVREFMARCLERDGAAVAVVGTCHASIGMGDPYLPFKTILATLCGDLDALAGCGNPHNAARIKAQLLPALTALLDQGGDLIDSLIPGRQLLAGLNAAEAGQAALRARLDARLERAGSRSELVEQGQIQAQYTRVLRHLAQGRPYLLVLEDLQWADIASIQLFFHLFRELGRCRLFLLGTYRPIEIGLGRNQQPHPMEAALQEIKRYAGDVWIDLDHLDPAENETFVQALLDAQPNHLGAEFRRAFLAHTGGNALFCTELLQSMKENGDLARDGAGAWAESVTVDWERLPARTEAVLQRRIAGLAEDELEALQIASVEGEVFTAELIARIGNLADRTLVKVLGQIEKRHGLVVTSTVERQGRQWLSHYKFLQAHIQKYIYRSLSPREKMMFHSEVGEFLEAVHAGQTDALALQLAWHFDQAGDAAKAVFHLTRAARNALRLSGYDEAEHLLRRALELLEEIPPGPEREPLELDLRIQQYAVIKVRKGWASGEIKPLTERALQLGAQLGRKGDVAPILFGRWAYYLGSLDLGAARRDALEYLEMAGELGDRERLVMANYALGNTLFWTGEFAEAERCLRRSLEDFDVASAAEHLQRYGQDSRVLALMMLTMTLFIRGEAEAEVRSREMLALARQLNHPFTLALALFGVGWLEQQRGNIETVAATAAELIALAARHKFPFYHGGGQLLRGWAAAMAGQAAAGREDLVAGWARISADGTLLTHSYYCLLSAQVDACLGAHARAGATLEQGLAMAGQREERAFEAELRRLRAQLLAEAAGDAARTELERAATLANHQGAVAFTRRIEETRASLGHVSGHPAACLQSA